MKTRKMIVPRSLIKRHFPHPEFYGESIVLLVNEMTTDVYTDLDGSLYTETNNTKLIEYLKNNNIPDKNYTLINNKIKLRSIKQNDLSLVLEWMNQNTDYSMNDYKYELEDIRIYISHSISYNSHLFIVEKDHIPVGLAGYDVIDLKGIIDIKIYEKESISNDNEDDILLLMIKHVHKEYRVTDFLSIIPNKDYYSHQIYTRNGFQKNEKNLIELPTSELEFQKAYIYEHKSFDIKIKESEKQVLEEFLELYPRRLYDLANSDQLIDIEHAIDYALKMYIRMILTNQLNQKDEFEDIYVDDNGLLNIEDNLLQKYDEIMLFLSGEDLSIAILYRKLIFPVLSIINRHIKIHAEKELYYFNN
jgi:hypothetical protein